MRLFYILKPDIIFEPKALEYYFDFIEKEKRLELINIYNVDKWVEIAKNLYNIDYESNELNNKKKQIVTTLIGYDIYFKNESGLVCLYDADYDQELLQELSNFKKELRKKFVVNTDKYYLNVKTNLDYSLPLPKIDLTHVLTESIVVSNTDEINDSDYQMVYFNKIHFPDPNIEKIEKEINILSENDIFVSTNIVNKNKVKTICRK